MFLISVWECHTCSWLSDLAKFWNIPSAISTDVSTSSESHRGHSSWLFNPILNSKKGVDHTALFSRWPPHKTKTSRKWKSTKLFEIHQVIMKEGQQLVPNHCKSTRMKTAFHYLCVTFRIQYQNFLLDLNVYLSRTHCFVFNVKINHSSSQVRLRTVLNLAICISISLSMSLLMLIPACLLDHAFSHMVCRVCCWVFLSSNLSFAPSGVLFMGFPVVL